MQAFEVSTESSYYYYVLEGQGVDVRLEDRGWRGFPTMGHDAVLELERL